MEITKQETMEIEVPVGVVCDVCKKVYLYDNEHIEIEEFTNIHFIAGYGSVFGDGNMILCDICQHCLHKMIGNYARILEE